MDEIAVASDRFNAMPFYLAMDLTELDAAMTNLDATFGNGPRDPDIYQGFEAALDINDEYQRREFLSASHGDGRWPDIADSTKYERARQAAGGFKRTPGVSKASRFSHEPFAFPVLFITGGIYDSLARGNPGHYSEVTDDSVSSGTDLARAYWNHVGGANLTSRPVERQPSEETLSSMSAPVTEGVARAVRKAVG